MVNLQDMTKDDLIKLAKMYAKNWLAHDGCWFLAIEEEEGMDKAIEMDTKSWERFTRVEAKRIMKEFGIEQNADLEGLKKALGLRLYACLNKDDLVIEGNKMIYTMVECRVQSARERKGLPLFPCKSVGIVEYSGFVETVNPKIQTRCIAAPPDELERDYHCSWEFTLID